MGPPIPTYRPPCGAATLEPSEPKVWVTCFVPFCPQLNGLASLPVSPIYLEAWLCKILVLALGLSRQCGARQKLTNCCNGAFQTDLVLGDPTLPVTFQSAGYGSGLASSPGV